MATSDPEITVEKALGAIPSTFRNRLVKAHKAIKAAMLEGNFDACGLRAGRFCEVMLRWAQHELTGTNTPFGTQLGSFRDECDKLEKTPKAAGHESVRVLIPRALNFLYTLRNKRGIGHEGGDIDANEIDALTAVRLADWCVCELLRLHYSVSLEEAQGLCDAIAERTLPQLWSVLGKKRVLDKSLSYPEQTLLLLYDDPGVAVPAEDLIEWTEHSNSSVYRNQTLGRMHRLRLIEYDKETQMVIISPLGIERVETTLLT